MSNTGRARPLAKFNRIEVRIDIQIWFKNVLYVARNGTPLILSRVKDVWDIDRLLETTGDSSLARTIEDLDYRIPLWTDTVYVQYTLQGGRKEIDRFDQQPLEGPIFNNHLLGYQQLREPLFVAIILQSPRIPPLLEPVPLDLTANDRFVQRWMDEVDV